MDDLMPNDGSTFYAPIQPEEQQAAERQEMGKAKAAMPQLMEIVDHFEARIAFFKSIESLSDELLTSPEEFMHQVMGNKIALANLQAEKEWLEDLIKRYQ